MRMLGSLMWSRLCARGGCSGPIGRKHMRSREKNRLHRLETRDREVLPPLEYARHRDTCGCGCQLTPAQWRAEAECEMALATVDFRGVYSC